MELEDSRRLLKAFAQSKGPVIHVLRQKEDVLTFLENNASSYPDYNRTTAAERWDIREQHYRECSSHEFVSLSVSMPSPYPYSTSKQQQQQQLNPQPNVSELTSLALKPVESSFLRLLRFIVGTDTNHVPTTGPTSPRTFLLSLTFPDLSDTTSIPPSLLDEISVGIDCWEIRLDWLRSVDPTFIALQIALLRRHSELPIRLTTRTRSQGGRFPDFYTWSDAAATNSATTGTIDAEMQKQIYDLVMLGYKLGCEYVDVELSWPEPLILSLIANRGNTKVIGSWHDTVGRITWTGRETRDIYEKGARLGVDIIEIINTARRPEDNISLRTFREQVANRGIPLIAFNMGPEVRLFFSFSSLLLSSFLVEHGGSYISSLTDPHG